MDAARVIEIIMDEASKVTPRYGGYVEDLKHSLAEIVNIERQHRFAARSVQKDIASQINTLGNDLAQHMTRSDR